MLLTNNNNVDVLERMESSVKKNEIVHRLIYKTLLISKNNVDVAEWTKLSTKLNEIILSFFCITLLTNKNSVDVVRGRNRPHFPLQDIVDEL